MITRRRQTTTRTLVPTLAEGLGYARAADACLTRARWIHFNNYATSFFRFGTQFIDKVSPSSVMNLFGKPHPCQSFDVQVFNCNQSKVIDKDATQFVMKIIPLLSNTAVSASKYLGRLTSTARSDLTPSNTSSRNSQMFLSAFVITRIRNCASVRKGRKGGNSYIDTNYLVTIRQWLSATFRRKQGVPFAILSLNSKSFNAALNRTMEPYPYLPYFRYVQFLTTQNTPCLPKCQTIVSRYRTKSWIARFLAASHAAKESIEGKMDAPQYILKRLGVDLTYISVLFTNSRHLRGLVKIGNPLLLQIPRIAPLLQGRIIKFATQGQLIVEQVRLSLSRVDPIPKDFEHLEKLYHDTKGAGAMTRLLPDLTAMELGKGWKGLCDGLDGKQCARRATLRMGVTDGIHDLCERCWKLLGRRHDRAELRAIEAAMNGEFSVLNPGVHLIGLSTHVASR